MAARQIKHAHPERYAMMLAAFCAGAHPGEIAKAFGHTRSTIRRLMRQNNWEAEREAHRRKLEKRHKTSLEKVQASNLAKLAKLKEAMWAKISPELEPGKDGKIPLLEIKGADLVKNLLEVMREEDRIMGGDQPGEGGNITVERAVVLANFSRREKVALKHKLLADLGMRDPAEDE